MSLLERMIARRAVAEAMSGTAGDVQKTSQATQQWCQSSYGQPEVDGANVLEVGTNEVGHTQSMIEDLGPCRAQLPPRLTSERTSVSASSKQPVVWTNVHAAACLAQDDETASSSVEPLPSIRLRLRTLPTRSFAPERPPRPPAAATSPRVRATACGTSSHAAQNLRARPAADSAHAHLSSCTEEAVSHEYDCPSRRGLETLVDGALRLEDECARGLPVHIATAMRTNSLRTSPLGMRSVDTSLTAVTDHILVDEPDATLNSSADSVTADLCLEAAKNLKIHQSKSPIAARAECQ
eukprot:Transcript_15606.p1 GENE.Transcript_15606~~Transcript_15606.p1  ORF type:complete len:295 (-),score=1.47 Transcript_15606:233-1117(-)